MARMDYVPRIQDLAFEFYGSSASRKNEADRKRRAARKRRESQAVASVLEVVGWLPARIREVVREIASKPSMREGIEAMDSRSEDFSSRTAAILSGISLVPEARQHFDRRVDEIWASDSKRGLGLGPMKLEREVVIGAGLHAAIYCAVRVATGHEPPIVIEQAEHPGGAFAVSSEPSFYLNSRNRPGGLSIPGMDGSLNVLPGALLQPSDLSGDEYQTNSALAWVIRTTLAGFGAVRSGRKVTGVDLERGLCKVSMSDQQPIEASRVIVATGLATERKISLGAPSERIMSFAQLMAAMDSPFPLRGMKRVAVIGAGDSGKTAIEALTGQGPSSAWSVASVDYPERIDWYGSNKVQLTRSAFETCNRSRYKGIARLLPRSSGQSSRVNPIQVKVSSIETGYESAYVDGKPYDHVIICAGYEQIVPFRIPAVAPFSLGSRQVAAKADSEVYVIGPASNLPLGDFERSALGQAGDLRENATALFRFADRTAALAAALS